MGINGIEKHAMLEGLFLQGLAKLELFSIRIRHKFNYRRGNFRLLLL
jgi:hypothetical protein